MNTYPQVVLGCLIICYLHQFGWSAPYKNEKTEISPALLARVLSIDRQNRSALTQLLESTASLTAKRSTPSPLMQALQGARNLAYVDYMANFHPLQDLLYRYSFHVSNRIYTYEYASNNS